MKLKNLLDLNTGDVVSIVGAGGKTSLMLAIAEELRDSRVLVTTSTKIFTPKVNEYDFISTDSDCKNDLKYSKSPGIYVLGKGIANDNKILGIDDDILQQQFGYYDYILIEADGSRRKPVKGWNADEPVILKGTNKTIGVLCIKVIGTAAKEENVHRVDKFREITGCGVDNPISVEDMVRLILHRKGLFKNALGEKILFINQVEDEFDSHNAEEIIEHIRRCNPLYIDKIISGSIKCGEYRLC